MVGLCEGRAFRGGWLSVLCVLACSAEPSLVYPELPSSGYFAVLYLDKRTDVVASSGLVLAASPSAVEINASSADATRVVLAGFDTETISGLTELEPTLLAEAALVRASPGGSALPAPAWWAAAELGPDPARLETAASGEPFPIGLTANWVPICDRSLERHERALLRLSCGADYCDGEVDLVGCDLVVRTNLCSPTVISAPVGSVPGQLGTPRVDGALSSCTAQPPRPDALFSMDCGTGVGCRLDVFPPDLSPRPNLVVQRSEALLPATPLLSSPEPLEVHGYLGGLAHSGERLLVSSFDGAADSRRCLQPHQTRLFVLRDDTLEVVGTSTAPGCLTALVSDTVSGGFIAVHGNPAEAIVRIDLDGRIVASGPVPPEVGASLVATAAVFDARPPSRGGPPTVAVTFGRSRTRERSYLVVFDAETLQTRFVGTSELDREGRTQDYLSVLLGGQPDEYVVLDRSHRAIWGFIADPEIAPRAYPLALCTGANEPMEMAPSRLGSLLFRSFDADRRGSIGVFGLRDESFCQRLGSFELPADPTALARWQGSDERYLVGLRSAAPEAEPRAYLGFFDAELPGFMPGLLELGQGDVGPFIDGREGAVYTTLPWSARVVRIEAAP